jgi:nicotinamide riboside transporter PnuC
MTPDGIALAAIVILIFPMGYFFLASPAFLLVKLDIPQVTQLLRGMFSAHFLMTSIAGVIGTVVFAVTGRLVFAIGVGLITAFAVWSRGWFLRQWDTQLRARDAGDADAVRRLRRLHWAGMLSNAIVLFAIVGSIPYVSATAA